ncbi:MAG: T9SS type A sorting domain-containing protein [bacterium]|nr:T9SS type A sorting domain-containing protein [bacterium]
MSKPGVSRTVVTAWLGLALVVPALSHAAWPGNPTVNVPVCTHADYQFSPVAAPDGTGGVFVAWRDPRAGWYAPYVQRIQADGTPAWTTDGIIVGSTSGMSYGEPFLTADGLGGVIVAWYDDRDFGSIYAQRLAADGTPQWPAQGVRVDAAVGNLKECALAADGYGGAIVFWRISGGSGQIMVAQHLAAWGASLWAAGGVVVGDGAALSVPVAVPDGLGGGIVAFSATVWSVPTLSYVYDVHTAQLGYWGDVGWQMNVTTAGGDQVSPAVASDGANGAIIAWADTRLGGEDIFAQHVQPGGVLPWGAAGVPVCTASYSQSAAAITSDGSGGAVVAWQDARSPDHDIYTQHLSSAGAQLWPATGVAVCTQPGFQSAPALVPGRDGGALAAWVDFREGSHADIYARIIAADGTPLGTAAGTPVSTAAGNQDQLRLVTNGNGGAIGVWRDLRNPSYDVFAQRITVYGALGSEPMIAHVRDVPNDQGGRLKLSWYASDLDASPAYGIGSYWIWRSVPPNYAAAALERGAPLLDAEAKSAPVAGLTLTSTVEGDKTIFWEYVGSQFAAADEGYSYVVPTTSDSLPSSNPLTLVRVQARAAVGNGFWNSPTGSGYSVDNLAPPQPAAFTGNTAGGATALHWLPVAVPDLAGYRLYRGATAAFVPGPGNLVAAQADTGYVDTPAGAHYYKLCAEDIHGNQGPFAVLAPQYTSGVDGRLPGVAVLSQNAPNPFNPRTTIRFTLPGDGVARLAIYDLAGRLVRTLVAGSLAAGEHEAVWDGCDDAGRAQASGSYLARLEAGGGVRTVRMALVR